MDYNEQQEPSIDFHSISLSVASPDDILDISHGEVTKPETINYRTQRPEKGGLFCEKIFGPVKNWECACGKYKRIRYKGVICEKCGVEVTKSIVRRERMGHIRFAVPVTHNWFVRTLPSRIGLLLGLGVKDLERVIYFASYIVTGIDDDARKEVLKEIDSEFKTARKQAQKNAQEEINKIKADCKAKKCKEKDVLKKETEEIEKIAQLDAQHTSLKKQLEELSFLKVISEVEYRNLSMRFGHIFSADSGSEAVRSILQNTNLDYKIEEHRIRLPKAAVQERKQIIKTLKLLQGLKDAHIRPEWMVLTVLPVLPPDLRPMVALEGGRFAASDLNDLYRRVINRNNRLKKLMEIGAPEVITRNEKRMLQEAVDALILGEDKRQSGNFRMAARRQLKSLSEMLKGKKGRFRQNLLGKRVDYSGRSVIVVGPELKLYQCGLPKKMALKLFKPFIIGNLIRDELAYNVKSAERYIAEGHKQVWNILEELSKKYCVLLNRAPTLHRLGIQAFYPVLIDGHAIQIHPLVCAAFNADFDGDQMAVHLPLSKEAQKEAKEIMLSKHNILKPSSGDPIINPSQDIILGVYYMTSLFTDKLGTGSIFANEKEALLAYNNDQVHLQAEVTIKMNDEYIKTTIGRILFNEVIDEYFGYINEQMNSKKIKKLFARYYFELGAEKTSDFSDKIKEIGFKYATQSGISFGKDDMIAPVEKSTILEEASELVRKINNHHWKGIVTQEEKYIQVIKIWTRVKSRISAHIKENFDKQNHIYYQVDSGARGNWEQITQMCGMKGLAVSPSGKTIELPMISSLKEGLSVLEYFISTHGGRKGKADTALRTANAGYLTRKLVDVAQEITIAEDDCGTEEFIVVGNEGTEFTSTIDKKVFGRVVASDVCHPKTGEIIVEKGIIVNHDHADAILEAEVQEVAVYSPITCENQRGICAKCYGFDLAYAEPIAGGVPVGIIAAQSIGEPGTQLTMRSFHSGGVATETVDMSQGLSRVEELFEARSPKSTAYIAEVSGKIHIEKTLSEYIVKLSSDNPKQEKITLPNNIELMVKVGDVIKAKQALGKIDKKKITTKYEGIVSKITKTTLTIDLKDSKDTLYHIPHHYTVLVESGDEVLQGHVLTNGHLDLRQAMQLSGDIFVQKYIVSQIQDVYNSQGQFIHDKHIEIIVRKMFSKVLITQSNYDNHLEGDMKDYREILNFNAMLVKNKQPLVECERLLLGLTKVALSTDSWLAAASFQETIRILVGVAVENRKDPLKGLKENVIIGRLIPVGKKEIAK
jgi:DNA-directed RNA polymerase subunit beta'